MMRKFALFLVLFSAVLASRWLFKPGYFIMHDDLQMMRQLQMEKCFQDRQIPCRWVLDMGYGYGYPLFNFYPPLPYYIGQVFRWMGFSFVWTAKLLFSLQFFLSGIAMFVLATNIWGVLGGLLSAVFYIWAPYHSVDVFVRGAMNEAWAFVWFPLIFWASKKLIGEEKFKYLVWLAFSYSMLLLTHGIMAMVFTPFLLLWIIYWILVERKFFWRKVDLLGKFVLSGLWSLGLSAFFVFPMLLEKKFTHIETMFSGYYDWRAHFASLRQLFLSRFWGWGPSVWGTEDQMSFSVGHIHWMLGAVVVLLTMTGLYRQLKRKEVNFYFVLPLGIFTIGVFYVFLAHQRSTFIWQTIKPLQLAQFPWRLLAVAAFSFSLLAGGFTSFIKQKGWIFALLVLVIAFDWRYFRPKSIGPLSDAEKFSGKAWEIQQTASIYDYLPKSAFSAPTHPPDFKWKFSGAATDVRVRKGSDWFEWRGKVTRGGELKIPIFYFPGWQAWLNRGNRLAISHSNDGLMKVLILDDNQNERNNRKQSVVVYFRFADTPVRSWANLFSLVSWWLLLAVILGPRLWKLIPRE
jgi:hypothetical protein